MKTFWMSGSALALALLLAGCGGSSGSSPTQPPPPPPPPPPVGISLSESAVTLTTSNPDYHVTNTHTFQAALKNASNTGVTWKVNGITGGDSMTGHGLITTNGLYTAPTFIPSEAITVTATSLQDPTKSASATVTLNWYVDNVYVTPNGTAGPVKTGEQLQLNAVATTLGPQTVTWNINGVKVGTPTLGALFFFQTWGANTAFYTAPPTVPNVPVIVTATSDANPTKSASFPVNVINSDSTEPSITVAPAEVTLELTKIEQFTASLTNTAGLVNWGLRRVEDGKLANGYLTGDGSVYHAPFEMPTAPDQVVRACINGDTMKCGYSIVHLTPPAVDPNTRLQGNYVITLHDRTYGMNLLGLMTANGNGNLQGTAEVNTRSGPASAQSFSGTYKIGVDGRGAAAITYTVLPTVDIRMNVRFMMVSDNLGYLYSSDQFMGETLGVIEKQTAPSFSNTDLSGNYAFLLRGFAWQTYNQPATTTSFSGIGAMTFNPDGTLTGSGDTMRGLLYQTISGTYTLQNNGMGSATLTFINYSEQVTSHAHFAMVSANKLYLLTTDDITSVSSNWPLLAGTAERQSGEFDDSSLTGDYAAYDLGEGWMQLLRFESTGTGALTTNGMSDQRDTSSDPPTVSTGVVFNGGYNVEANGRVNAGFDYFGGTNPLWQVKLYLISPSKFYILVPTSSGGAAGEGYTQTAGTSFDWAALTGRYALRGDGYGSDGVGWLMPFGYGDETSDWIGWFDNLTGVKNDIELLFYGSGRAGAISGINLSFLRYYVVSDSKILVMSTDTSRTGNVLLTLDKLQSTN